MGIIWALYWSMFIHDQQMGGYNEYKTREECEQRLEAMTASYVDYRYKGVCIPEIKEDHI